MASAAKKGRSSTRGRPFSAPMDSEPQNKTFSSWPPTLLPLISAALSCAPLVGEEIKHNGRADNVDADESYSANPAPSRRYSVGMARSVPRTSRPRSDAGAANRHSSARASSKAGGCSVVTEAAIAGSLQTIESNRVPRARGTAWRQCR